MSLFAAAVYPGRALGFIVLGASLHDILTRLKAEPQSFPKLDLIYSPSKPVNEPVIVNLPSNGIRLRFDGPGQRLRLIEVLDFLKNKLTYNNHEIIKPSGVVSPGPLSSSSSTSGPTFRHVYNKLLGPSFAGEYVAPDAGDESAYGLYIFSYPGIAFSFPLLHSAWTPEKDYAALLSSSAAQPAVSMAIFYGESWTNVRHDLYTHPLQDLKSSSTSGKAREAHAEEVGTVVILGEGRLEMRRPWSGTSFWLTLGQTSPQELVAELGPPDAIYRKSDQRMLIHKARTASGSRSSQSGGNENRLQDESTDTDHSSAHTATDNSEDESEVEGGPGNISAECFYNYFYHGFDILVSVPSTSSGPPPSAANDNHSPSTSRISTDRSSSLVATKIILHSNVPGSYSFNRHRRCRWEIGYLSRTADTNAVSSESSFDEISNRLYEEWNSIYASVEEARQRQRGMVLNRGWGNSPGSSCEFLGGWEESGGGKRIVGVNSTIPDEEQGLGNTTLYGFPGLVFEVLKNGTVSGLTVF